MRNKIIAVNAVIVALVGLLAFVIVRTQLSAATTSPELLKRSAQQDAGAVSAKLQLNGLRAERWLGGKALEPSTRAALSKATPDARGDAATALCDQLASAAVGALGVRPSIVAVIDQSGRIVGRNGSNLSRGDDVGSSYAAFKDALAKGQAGSDLWTDPKRADNLVASYAPARDDQGRAVGMLVLGVAITDALARVTENTGSRGVLLVNAAGDVLGSTSGADGLKASVKSATSEVAKTIASGTTTAASAGDLVFAAAPLEGFADGKQSAIVAAAPTSLLDGAAGIPISILGVTALGLVLVVAGGFVLGNYVSGPIAQLEEGLLAILNGQTDKRFELDHPELGGLAFRIDQLLNQLMGVEEDTTDEEGRVSKAPTAANFNDALAVDRSQAGGGGAAPAAEVDAARLAAEPADQYYARLYREYIAAKKALGEQVDHITDAAFTSRIQGMEQDATQKQGRPVRYHVQTNGREVVLLAVPV